jgi:DNA-binding transcriptional regulator LsrR (DeoR family)
MRADTKIMLQALKDVLGTRRRYRIARMALGRELTQRQIARRLSISQPTVHRELQAIAQVQQEVRQQQDAIRLGLACPFPAPSLN